jgi:hypothetical protein
LRRDRLITHENQTLFGGIIATFAGWDSKENDSMKRVLKIAAAACVFLAVTGAGQSVIRAEEEQKLVFNATPPGDEPEPFLPDIILDSVHSAPSFTPDGTEMYYSRYYTPEGRRSRTQHIFIMRLADGKWSAPELVSFSGRFADGGPFVTSDGLKLFFYSNRPTEPGGEPSDEYISDIWFVERSGDKWGEPQWLGFNTDKLEGMASVADNGNIYFQSNRKGTRGIFDVYISEWIDGKYTKPKNLGPLVNCPQINFSPLVAPDESYIILTYNNNAPNNGLHVCFRQPDGGWTKAAKLEQTTVGSTQRFPGLTPDGRYLFFVGSISRKGVVYWIDAGIINDLRKQVVGE